MCYSFADLVPDRSCFKAKPTSIPLLTDSEEVTFNLNGHLVIAGYAVETSQFVTAIAIALLVVVFVAALTYKRLLKIFMKGK